MKRTFDIPVTWMMSGTERIEAETLPEAIAIAQRPGRPLPKDQQYVDDSYQVEEELACTQNMPKGSGSLRLHSTTTLLNELKVRTGRITGSPSATLSAYTSDEIQEYLWVCHGVKFEKGEDT